MRVMFVLLAGLLVVGASESSRAQDDLSVVADWMAFSDVENSLYHHLSAVGQQQLGRRDQRVEELVSRADWRRRQKEVRERLRNAIGPFPDRTPLRTRVVDTLDRPGYRVENLIYESVPGVHVTGSLFVPKNIETPAPAVLYLSGHAGEAYRSDTYQRVILNLVAKGFVVMAIDPIGQGERRQYAGADAGQFPIEGATDEHSYVGAQSFLTGRSPAWLFAWDGIRAIDYLVERPEVDPRRIGVTGRSGGGTQTAYVSALDERVRAAAPENYITSFQRLLQSIGPQDAEQNIFHGLARGLDHADLLTVRAPRPTLMITTTRDFFSIQGTQETAREVERAYAAFGARDRFERVEDDAAHASTTANREALYAFFQRHLDRPGSPEDEDVSPLSASALHVTDTGQVVTSLDGRTVFSLVQARAERQLAALDSSRRDLESHLPAVVRAAKSQSGFRPPAEEGTLLFTGRHQRSGYMIEKYVLDRKETYPIPFLLAVPNEDGPHPGLLYLHPEGKTAQAGEGEAIERLAKQGHVVLAPDLVGRGETGPGQLRGDSYIDGVSYNQWFASVLTGRSIVGLRARDLVRLTTLLQERSGGADETVAAVAQGTTAPALLHAAAFDDRIGRVALHGPLLSYGSLAVHERYDPQFIPVSVAGALRGYDLPDLLAGLAPRPVLVTRPLDHRGQRASAEAVETAYEVGRRSYAQRGRAARLRVERTVERGEERSLMLDWPTASP